MRKIISTMALVFVINISFAGEGMWLPLLLKSLNESEMQAMGMKLTAEDIYSINRGSLKDAIVHFGGFCTSELISSNGLMLTNHHCGYSQIQSHSTLEDNYLKNGFWAKNHKDEKANPGLSATLINEIRDVTEKALRGVTENMSVSDREELIKKNLEHIREHISKKDYQEVLIRPFYNGNQYFAFLTTKYLDVRLVGAPPESIGKFGADTDNWVWPRHTGDFSLFRIYAGPDNMPAEYSEDNVPYKPKHFLPISLDGVEVGDFTMVFGFPGRTQEYLPSPAVTEIVESLNPAKIEIRETALNILDKYMRQDEETRLKYSSKFARIANYWKKWIGESTGLKKTKAIEKKQNFEKKFTSALPKDSPYRNILPEFEKLYEERAPYAYVRDYYSEVVNRNIELLRVASLSHRLVNAYESEGKTGYNNFKGRLTNFLQGFYKDYDATIDKEVFTALLQLYADKVDNKYMPSEIQKGNGHVVTNYKVIAEDVYEGSAFTSLTGVMNMYNKDPEIAVSEIKADPAYILYDKWQEVYNKNVASQYDAIDYKLDSLQRVYMGALMKTFPNEKFYPDANSTLRVTYGQVEGYSPSDAQCYEPVTYLDGVMEKYKPGDYEFDVDSKLVELYENKDYGDYADSGNGKLPVCFIGTNHTTGGNSGSPAIDAHGNLIGLNFDRAWEGTMSDINYDPSICRNIMVDARYILFVIDKFAGAKHLIDEMSLVRPKEQAMKDAKKIKSNKRVSPMPARR